MADRLEIGRIAKPHGLLGECIVALTTDRIDERCRPGQVWWMGDRALEVTAVRPHQHRWLVSFEGVYDRDSAQALAGEVLTAEGIEDPEALWVHDLVGSEVRDRAGVTHGRVVAVMDNPAHPILELDTGALVPTVFVVSCTDGVTVVDPPVGLFD